MWKTLTWTFTFLEGISAIFGELSNFSLLGETSSILFWAGPVKKDALYQNKDKTNLNIVKAVRGCLQ